MREPIDLQAMRPLELAAPATDVAAVDDEPRSDRRIPRMLGAAMLPFHILIAGVPVAVLGLLIQLTSSRQVVGAMPFKILLAGLVANHLARILLGRNHDNLDADQASRYGRAAAFTWLLWLSGSLTIAAIIIGSVLLPRFVPGDWVGFIGLSMFVGQVSAVGCIVVAHELVHRNQRVQRLFGGVLLSFACYASFKIEHVHGHHRDVGTDQDASSAVRGQNIYSFLIRAIACNYATAWRISLAATGQRGVSAWLRCELSKWTLLQLVIVIALGAAGGLAAAAFFLAQSLFAIIYLETINYVQHYGLRRRRRSDGGHEPVDASHSWNATYWREQWGLVNLGRHSDHHLYSARPYQILRISPDAPQLPMPLTTAVYCALIPPLWCWVMDPILDYYHQHDVARSAQHG